MIGNERKTCVLGVAGGSASGKTTIIKKIQEYFGEDIAVISHDNYYKAHFEERCKLNYDHPDSFESERMAEDVRKLLRGEYIDMPTYDYRNHNRAKETIRIAPKTVIIMEGILILENRGLRDLMDIKIYVDTDADERLIRRMRSLWNHRNDMRISLYQEAARTCRVLIC